LSGKFRNFFEPCHVTHIRKHSTNQTQKQGLWEGRTRDTF